MDFLFQEQECLEIAENKIEGHDFSFD